MRRYVEGLSGNKSINTLYASYLLIKPKTDTEERDKKY